MEANFFHPLDLVEEIVAANDWQFERAEADFKNLENKQKSRWI